jgi:PAS domain-containing protein
VGCAKATGNLPDAKRVSRYNPGLLSPLNAQHNTSATPPAARITCLFPVSDLSATLPSSEEVSAVFEHASLGMALSRNRVIVRCNRVFAQLFGKPVVEWIGLPGASIFPDERAYEQFGQLAGPVLSSGGIYRGEHVFQACDGKLLTCVVSASAVNPAKPTEGTIWVFDDVTAERDQQRALREALQRFESLMANAPVGIIQTANRCIVDANPAFWACLATRRPRSLACLRSSSSPRRPITPSWAEWRCPC